jgi:hypothetical protein
LALATLVWPAVSQWCRRLVETLGALILSKFVIVATLSLAAGAVSSGTAGTGPHGAGFSAVLAGGALLVMATFVPFAILRMIPAVEAGAVSHLEGLRSGGTSALTRLPRSAAGHALNEGLQALGEARLMAATPAAGGAARAGGGAAGGAASGTASTDDGSERSPGIELGEGDPNSQRIYDESVARGSVPGPKGPKPILAPRAGAADGADSDADAGRPLVGKGGRRLGPATPEDAWKWEGVPAGYTLLNPVEPGKTRHCEGDDGHGPQLKWLPAVWPPGQGPDAGSGAAGGAGT